MTLTATLRILVDMMATTGRLQAWTLDCRPRSPRRQTFRCARRNARILPPMAMRTLRLGEETGQLPMLADRIAGYYEAKLQRSLDRLVGVVGPAAIVLISVIVGGLIVSVMTALLSVSQVIN